PQKRGDRGSSRIPAAGLRRAPRRSGGDAVSAERKLAAFELAERAKLGARQLLRRDRRQLVLDAANAIEKRAAEILGANEVDLARASGQPAAFLDRLRLDEKRLRAMAAALRRGAAPPGPVG